MRLVTFINNHQTSQLFQNHINRLDCGRIGQKSNPQYTATLRNADLEIYVLSADVQRLAKNYVLFK